MEIKIDSNILDNLPNCENLLRKGGSDDFVSCCGKLLPVSSSDSLSWTCNKCHNTIQEDSHLPIGDL